MKLLMNGTLYQGSKPVMWSPVEKTALAEAEVEYHEHTSHTIWVKFPVVGVDCSDIWNELPAYDPGDLGYERAIQQQYARKERFNGVSILIWTTTPWTIPQNRAVCFGPEISYGLYEVSELLDGAKEAVGAKIIIAEHAMQVAALHTP